jgi:Uncharacterized protein conserved in bacteria (DUF2188)
MARSVKITTPLPTLEEFGEALGLSKSRIRSLAPIFIERRDGGYIIERRDAGDYAVRRPNSERASAVFPTQREAIERARELNPSGRVLVERVRDTSDGSRDKWRKP